ncbi:BlaI/MecI/CopY family transcriptional regulator [Singulisphaera sp. PoT]|uniref:BlaI/MecI/CopY family transcriptional regulator n=1 Tax=Singulisphaera sp. PoT TaxID=3411797 RepID=UPI003BF5018C
MKLPDEPLSPAQQEIMEIVWEQGEVAAVEVRQMLAEGRELARETVRTMLERMEAKGWLTHRVVGRTFFYAAAVPRGASTGQKVIELIDTVCGGSPERLMTALLDYRGLSEEEATRIEALIKQAKDKGAGRRG